MWVVNEIKQIIIAWFSPWGIEFLRHSNPRIGVDNPSEFRDHQKFPMFDKNRVLFGP